MNQDNTKSVEIDVLALLHKLWTKKLLILFTAFYFAAFSFLGTYFFIQPTYTSTLFFVTFPALRLCSFFNSLSCEKLFDVFSSNVYPAGIFP